MSVSSLEPVEPVLWEDNRTTKTKFDSLSLLHCICVWLYHANTTNTLDTLPAKQT